ncbi:TPA: HI1506-related protein [Pasteurella multocida]|uniref:HI1506-related protein n=1 Tax=Pasteurella multocida TaxID=747 RepID=UPI0023E36C61|nr:HI1506-related protein [Pasteurella multocida]
MSEIQNHTLYQVVVFNKTDKDGYRRAGFSLLKGSNLLTNVTQAQLAQFKADPRLVLQSQEPMQQENSEKTEQGVSEVHSDNQTPQRVESAVLPADLTTEQLKDWLTEKGITFNKSAKKAELIALVEQASQGVE